MGKPAFRFLYFLLMPILYTANTTEVTDIFPFQNISLPWVINQILSHNS
jgi:hypothetical protein